MAKQAFQTVTVKPLLGQLDTRSFPSDVPLGVWRWRLNTIQRDGTKCCRRPGWEKLFSGVTPYVNQDFHDKGSVAVPTPTQEYITLEFEATTNNGQRYLYAGTQSQLAWLDEVNKVWNSIGTGFGGTPVSGLPQTRFKAAALAEKVIFTNNVDPVKWHTMGSTAPVADITSLLALPVTAAAVVVEFSGFMMVMNVVEGGTRVSSRIWWSDFEKPLDFNPGTVGSLSNFQDLDYGDQILASVPMAGALYIFTSRAIWRCTPTGDDLTVFSFQKVYSEPENQAKCLVYPNTLVSTGTSCWYASAEAIYYYDPYVPEPVRHEWLFRASSIMFSDDSALSPECCQSPVAGVRPSEKEIWISWPESTSAGCVNSKTLVFNYEYQSADIIDFGFSALDNYRPSTPDSAVCKGATQLFVGASVEDYSLKQIGSIFAREVLDNIDGQGTVSEGVFTPFTGIYSYVGYYTVLRMLLPLVNYDRDKTLRQILIEPHSTVETNENVFRLRLGNTFSEADPNLPDEKCAVLWHRQVDKPIECLDTKLPSSYVQENLVRNSGTQWPCMIRGRFIYLELVIASGDGTPAIGGDCCISRIELQVQLQPI